VYSVLSGESCAQQTLTTEPPRTEVAQRTEIQNYRILLPLVAVNNSPLHSSNNLIEQAILVRSELILKLLRRSGLMDTLIKSLPAILKASGASEEVAEAACIVAWRHAVGEGLSMHAIPVRFDNTKLVVVVADNIWQKQLEPLRGQLLFRLNSVLGQPLVRSMELRVDPEVVENTRKSNDEGKDGSDLKSNQPVPIDLLSAAAGIEDAGLRRAFLGAAASCIRRLENKSND
jgi:hypothetical protein